MMTFLGILVGAVIATVLYLVGQEIANGGG